MLQAHSLILTLRPSSSSLRAALLLRLFLFFSPNLCTGLLVAVRVSAGRGVYMWIVFPNNISFVTLGRISLLLRAAMILTHFSCASRMHYVKVLSELRHSTEHSERLPPSWCVVSMAIYAYPLDKLRAEALVTHNHSVSRLSSCPLFCFAVVDCPQSCCDCER